MNYLKANDQLSGRCKDRRKIANNTYLERRANGNIALRLHNTDVLTFSPNGDVRFDSGGFLTVTTKQRMNEFQDVAKIWSTKGVWYLRLGKWWTEEPEQQFAYADGITVHSNGTVTGMGEDPARILKMKRKIKAFCQSYMDAFMADKVPAPDSGDCWYCLMSTTNGKGLGEAMRDTSHLESHMSERYYVPILLARAVKRFPVSRCANELLARMWTKQSDYPPGIQRVFGGSFDQIGKEQLQKSLKRYITEQFGMQA